MRHLLLVFTIAATSLLALNSCSVKYTPRIPGFQPGYVDEQLGKNTYQVQIGEAWSSDWPNLEKFALYRAADIAQNHGYQYFAVLSASSYTNTYYISTPSTSFTSGTASVVGNTAYLNTTTTSTPAVTSGISGGWYVMDYKLIDQNEINSYDRVVDATNLKEDLKVFIENRR